MPRKKQPWFRFYVEAIRDRKLRLLKPAHRWLWVVVLACAKESPIPGFLMLTDRRPISEADLADAAALKVPEVAAGLEVFADLALIEWDEPLRCWHVTRWNDRQFESDNTAERTAKHRSQEERRNVPTSAVVTPPENRVQKTDTDTEAEVLLAPKSTAREKDHIFEALTAACGINPEELTKTARGALNKAVKDLRDVGADHSEIHRRARNYPTVFPGAVMTPNALARQWAQLAQARAPTGPYDPFAEMAKSALGREDTSANGTGSADVADSSRRSLPS